MQQKELSNIAIGSKGTLVIGVAKITQKSPLYDRLGSPGYLNPRAFCGAELINTRFGEAASEKFANAIANAAMKIMAEYPRGLPGRGAGIAIVDAISSELGSSQGAMNIRQSRNTTILSIFDVCARLGMAPELSVGQNYDMAVTVKGVLISNPDDKSRYKTEEREEVYVALTPAQACSAVHLVLGKEAQQRAHERKRNNDRAAWKTEMAEAIRHYEDAVAFDAKNSYVIYDLSGAYADIGQHGKASDVYQKAFDTSESSGDKAYYSQFLAENAVYSKDVQRMIVALRSIEAFCEAHPDKTYVQVAGAVKELTAALDKALRS